MTGDLVKRLREQVVMIACDDPSDMSKFLEHEAAARIEALEAVAKQAADWFEEYEKSHAAKGDIASDAKARRNADRAAFCRAALEAAAAQPSREAELVKAARGVISVPHDRRGASVETLRADRELFEALAAYTPATPDAGREAGDDPPGKWEDQDYADAAQRGRT